MLKLEEGSVQAIAIPYKNFAERIRITKEEQKKKREVTFDSENVYSFPRKSKYVKFKGYRDSGATKTFENFKCFSCDNEFRIVALDDVQWAICPRCGGANIDKLTGREETDFENKIN